VPTVPRINEPQVRQAPIPGQRLSGSAPIEAFGGGQAVGGVFREAGGLVADAQKIQDEHYGAAVTADVASFMDKIRQKETDLKTQLSNVRGKDAFPASDKALADFDTYHQELQKEIQNDDVRKRVQAHYGQYRAGFYGWAVPYANEQGRQYTLGSLEAMASSEQSAVDLDPSKERVLQSIMRQSAAIEEMGKIEGVSPKVVEALQDKAESATHMRVLRNMFAGGNDLSAAAYFAANEGFLVDKDLLRARELVQVGSTRGESQRLTDRIFSTYYTEEKKPGETDITAHHPPETLEQALEEARKIKDPDLQDAVVARVKDRWEEKRRSEQEAYQGALKDATDTVLNTGSTDTIPPGLRRTDVMGLEALAKQMRTKAEPVTDDAVLTEIMLAPKEKLAAYTEERALVELRPYLNKADYEQALAKISAAQDPKNAEKFQGLYSDDQMIFQGAKDVGLGGIKQADKPTDIEKDGDKVAALARFKKEVNTKIAAYHQATGKNPDDTVKQKAVDEVALFLKKKVRIKTYNVFGGDVTELRALVPFTDKPEKRIADLTPADIRGRVFDIPWPTREGFFNLARSVNGQVHPGTTFREWEDANREQVNLAYLAALGGASDERVLQILSGKK